MAKSNRDEWRRRVRQWKRSGLSAREFSERAGIRAATLSYWKWRLAREERESGGSSKRSVQAALVELSPVAMTDDRIELELPGGSKLRIPATFDAQALGRLLAVLGGAS